MRQMLIILIGIAAIAQGLPVDTNAEPVLLSGDNVCNGTIWVDEVVMEKVTRTVNIEEKKSLCFSGDCTVTRQGTKVEYVPRKKKVEKSVRKCCDGYYETSELVCKPKEDLQWALPIWLLASIIVIILAVVVFAIATAHYRKKYRREKDPQLTVVYQSTPADVEDSGMNEISNPGYDGGIHSWATELRDPAAAAATSSTATVGLTPEEARLEEAKCGPRPLLLGNAKTGQGSLRTPGARDNHYASPEELNRSSAASRPAPGRPTTTSTSTSLSPGCMASVGKQQPAVHEMEADDDDDETGGGGSTEQAVKRPLLSENSHHGAPEEIDSEEEPPTNKEI